jgi:nucleoside-diphosphate-sugar epimerase
MTSRLLDEGYDVVAVSSRPVKDWIFSEPRATNVQADLRCANACYDAVAGSSEVYNFAAKVGGIGYIEGPTRSACLESVLININLLRACEKSKTFEKYFFSSSACVYGEYFTPSTQGLVPRPCLETDRLDPSPGYGEEKAYSERVCAEFAAERRMDIRIARYFTLYGEGDINKDGKDHVPTALAKKWARAKRVYWMTGVDQPVNIWGTGDQIRSFLHVKDAIEGTRRMMRLSRGTNMAPLLLNMANPAEVSVRDISCYLDEISGFYPERSFDIKAPTGVQYRAACTWNLKDALGWEPSEDFRKAMWPIFADCWARELGTK